MGVQQEPDDPNYRTCEEIGCLSQAFYRIVWVDGTVNYSCGEHIMEFLDCDNENVVSAS